MFLSESSNWSRVGVKKDAKKKFVCVQKVKLVCTDACGCDDNDQCENKDIDFSDDEENDDESDTDD